MIYGIVAVDNNWGIGKNNDLLFHLKEDMKFFKNKTDGNIVCMGENTLLSFPGSKPLKNKVNVVLCPEGHEYENCICIHDFDQMIHFIKTMSKIFPVFVIGGAMFYKSMLPYYDKIFVTHVDAADPEAMAFFPNLAEHNEFKITEQSEELEEAGYKFKFTTYTRN